RCARIRLVRRVMPLEPRIRVSAVLRWQDRILLCKHEKAGRGDYWLLPGGGVNSGESLTDALHRELREGAGIEDALPVDTPSAGRPPRASGWAAVGPRAGSGSGRGPCARSSARRRAASRPS